jgi:anti-sigma regulatory factor (Ser/Thr protein kinase)
MSWQVSFVLSPDTASASIARERVQRWLAELGWPSDEADDIVYAVSEAVTNSAEHAFEQPGRADAPLIRIDCRVREDADSREIWVLVTDNGSWKPRDASPGHRGHGLRLIRALADYVSVTTGESGTAVAIISRSPVARARGPIGESNGENH